MKMTSFIVGSVLGMVGAFALMQRKPGMAKAMQGAMSDVKGNMMSMAMSKFSKPKKGWQGMDGQQAFQKNQAASQTTSKAQQESNHQPHPSNHQMNVSMIEGIIKNDPELQDAVNEIKDEAKSIRH